MKLKLTSGKEHGWSNASLYGLDSKTGLKCITRGCNDIEIYLHFTHNKNILASSRDEFKIWDDSCKLEQGLTIRRPYLINQICPLRYCLIGQYSLMTQTWNLIGHYSDWVYSKHKARKAKNQAKQLRQLFYTPEVGFFFLYYTLHEEQSPVLKV